MRKALVVGIDYYEHTSPLHGCVNDAHSIKPLLERNADGTVNFAVKPLTGTSPNDQVPRAELKDSIEELFSTDDEIALLYFAGHGHIEATGGYLLASDSRRGDEGVSLSEILILANNSRSKNKVIALDSCHSGIAGSPGGQAVSTAELKEGTTILTASTSEQYASERNGSGVFTALFADALVGSAANLVGDITPGSVYAHIDQSLGPWDQRPIFKTNVKSFVSLRKAIPSISLAELQRIAEFFPAPGYRFSLDPTYEPEMQGRKPGMPPPNPEHTHVFAILQKYNRVNLVVPVDAPHMWHAAMESKACKLTLLGEHYRRLVEQKRI
ncbi:MAG: caspase family protein [Myxococcales bacterium]|nr:caspase family protein [Myxococcales bacterium]